jgi:hypothetical protein
VSAQRNEGPVVSMISPLGLCSLSVFCSWWRLCRHLGFHFANGADSTGIFLRKRAPAVILTLLKGF